MCTCKVVHYCGSNCQKSHWKAHKAEHRRRVSALAETKATADCFLGSGENCVVCLDELPRLDGGCMRLTCCGKRTHTKCVEEMARVVVNKESHFMKSSQLFNCPHCRQGHPTEEVLIDRLQKWVKKDKPWAQTMLGEHYYDGNGVPQSFERATQLYKLAVNGGEAMAMTHLGAMYAQPMGQCGIEQSFEKAKELFEQSAEQGEPEAQCSLGRMYYEGICVKKSFDKAFELYGLSAEQGNAEAQFMMTGLCMQQLQQPAFQKSVVKGNPTVALKIIAKGTEWCEKAAEQGHEGAISTLKGMQGMKMEGSASSTSSKVCSKCGETSAVSTHTLKPCPRCHSVYYCNSNCRKTHWKSHKKDCKRSRR